MSEQQREQWEKVRDELMDIAIFLSGIDGIKTMSSEEKGKSALELACKAIVKTDAHKEMLERTIAFFASVIKGGEPWTNHCQRHLEAAFPETKDDKDKNDD